MQIPASSKNMFLLRGGGVHICEPPLVGNPPHGPLWDLAICHLWDAPFHLRALWRKSDSFGLGFRSRSAVKELRLSNQNMTS